MFFAEKKGDIPTLYSPDLEGIKREEAVLFLLPLKKAYSLLSGIKGILAKTADGADPIFGNVLPDCAGGNTVVGVAQGGVIDIAAGAFIFHGNVSSYLPK